MVTNDQVSSYQRFKIAGRFFLRTGHVVLIIYLIMRLLTLYHVFISFFFSDNYIQMIVSHKISSLFENFTVFKISIRKFKLTCQNLVFDKKKTIHRIEKIYMFAALSLNRR